ncbi:hypothetical protein QL285_058272 [Trifolium repens]|nr:hypothetical protein QL285_058272 [Trifolium repens]
MVDLDKKALMAEMYETGTTLTKKYPPSSQLKHEFKMLHNMCLHSIFPRKGSKDKVTKKDMMMMYHMFNKVKLNLPYVMIQHMIYTIEYGNKKTTLPYGMFLTRVFNHFDVNVEGEEAKKSTTTFSLTNIGRMKQICDIEDHTVRDQGLKRKREVFEEPEPENLQLLADVVTTQEDHLENVLPIPTPSDKGKQVMSEGNPSDSRDLGFSLEFDSAFEDNLGANLNKFTSVLLDGFSTIDNPVNTSLFSPLITSPQTTFHSFQQTEILRNLMKNPIPNFPQFPQPIFTDVGPSLPSFPPNFPSLGSFCTNAPNHDTIAYQGSDNPPPFDPRPLKRSKVEKDVARTRKDMEKMFNILSFIMQ